MDMTPKERHLLKLISKQVKLSYGTNSRLKLTPFMVHVFFLARHALRVRVIRTFTNHYLCWVNIWMARLKPFGNNKRNGGQWILFLYYLH